MFSNRDKVSIEIPPPIPPATAIVKYGISRTILNVLKNSTICKSPQVKVVPKITAPAKTILTIFVSTKTDISEKINNSILLTKNISE